MITGRDKTTHSWGGHDWSLLESKTHLRDGHNMNCSLFGHNAHGMDNWTCETFDAVGGGTFCVTYQMYTILHNVKCTSLMRNRFYFRHTRVVFAPFFFFPVVIVLLLKPVLRQ